MKSKKSALIYSCSGCSSAAQMANYIAVKIDRSNIAEMSCIAGVGGGVKSLVITAKSDRPIVTIDGCALKCTQACLNNVGLKSNMPYVLSDYEVRKKQHEDFSKEQADELLEKISSEIKDKFPTK